MRAGGSTFPGRIAVFEVPPDEVDQIMADDPGVTAGVFTHELLPVRGFPGSTPP